jgi:hypothetical protein
LYKEYLIASFLPVWDFKSSPINLIKVSSDHIPSDLGISKNCFKSPCFGLQKVDSSNELDKHNTGLLNRRHLSYCFKDDFLKLSFFDIWVANEDRSHNNYNLLLAIRDGFYELYPIDHEACFNHGELASGLTPITYEESLIYSEAFNMLFKKGDFTRSSIAALRDKYYVCVEGCKDSVDRILNEIPPEWGIDVKQEKQILDTFLFNDVWFHEAWTTFQSYIQLFLN